MNDTPTVELKNLTTGYRTRRGDVAIGTNLNARLLRGELTCLLGPNGAGKSTLMRTIAGLLQPMAGEVEIDGKPVGQYDDSELSKLISVVLTEKPSVSSMTVGELVAMGRSPYTDFWGRMDDSDREIVTRSLQLASVADKRHRLVDTLSDGERQKVMIAKALAQETPIILLDEPTAFLDFPSKVETLVLLRKLAREEGKTIFQSTHDINLALELSDRIWLLDKSTGFSVGTPRQLADNGELERFFNFPWIEFNRKDMMFRARKDRQ